MKFAVLAIIVVALAPVPASAALTSATMAAGPMILRGKVVSYVAPDLTIKGRDGKKITLQLAPDAQASTVTIIPIDAIKPGSYIGTAAESGKDGVLRALEVHVFPEAMRGTGDGHYGWNLTKTSSMTNGNVRTVAEQGKARAKARGRVLAVDYKGGSRQVLVPANVPIVAFAPAQLSQLAAGVPVFVIAQPQPGGKLVANRVTLGTNGVAPPM